MAAVMSPLRAAPLMRQAEVASGATPAFRSGHDSGQRTTVQRAAMRVSSPTDAAEREASDVARRVVQMPPPGGIAGPQPCHGPPHRGAQPDQP